MIKEEFYIVLLSNSSMTYYPENTTSHFDTKHLALQGEWVVGLTEIQIPLIFQHLFEKLDNNTVTFTQHQNKWVTQENAHEKLRVVSVDFELGLHEKLDDLLEEINKASDNSHMIFSRKSGGYVRVELNCECKGKEHFFQPSSTLKKMLDFQHNRDKKIFVNGEFVGNSPANLNSDLPMNLLVYSDLCAPYKTGDAFTRLLRNVTVNFQKYSYGSMLVKNFFPPNYFPLLNSSFQTIKIDIRDEFGNYPPFDYGTVTLTLHFKRAR